MADLENTLYLELKDGRVAALRVQALQITRSVADASVDED